MAPNLALGGSQRRQQIMHMLAGKKNGVSIKEVSVKFGDLSQKTIQRELAVLVARGFVTKEGERRWSRYSLSERGHAHVQQLQAD